MGSRQIAFLVGAALRSFGRSTRGAVGGAVAVAGTLFLGFAILAVDVGVAEHKRQNLQRALDSAILSAAVSMPVIKTDAERTAVETIVKTHVEKTLASVPAGELTVTVTASSDPATGVSQLQAAATQKNQWLAAILLGGEAFREIQVSSALTRPDGRRLEIALVLDNTWSMSGGSKMADLKGAATGLVNTLMTTDAPVKIAVIPYTEYVNVGTGNRSASWLSVGADSSTTTSSPSCSRPCLQSTSTTRQVQSCTGGCSGGGCTDGICTPTVCTPQVCRQVSQVQTTCVRWGAQSCTMRSSTTTRKWSGCVGSRPSPLNVGDSPSTGLNKYPGLMNETRCPGPVTPLTDNKGTVLSAISGMKAEFPHETYIPAGLVWGLAALTDSAPLTEAAPSADKSVTKALILMTDGDNTRSMQTHSANPGKFGHQGANKAATDTATAQLCANIRAQDISVYTVAFNVSNPATLSMLTSCASGSGNAFSASDGAQLSASFKSIADSLREIALVQ